MPDNKKQGRTSNKAMTFFVWLPRRPGWITHWSGYRRDCGATPFVADGFQISAHSGMGGELHDVQVRRSVLSAVAGSPSDWAAKEPDDWCHSVRCRFTVLCWHNVEVLLVSRVLLGLAIGVASYTALYLSKSRGEIRGEYMISMYQH